MINAAIVGLGWWGKTVVESVSGISDAIRFVAATTRSRSDDARQFASEHKLDLRSSYDDIISDPDIDAVVLVTPIPCTVRKRLRQPSMANTCSVRNHSH